MKRGIILTESDLREVVKYFKTKDRFAFDIESYGEHRGVPHLAPISWMSLATDGAGVVVPMGHPIGTKIVGERPEYFRYKTGKRAGELHEKPTMVPVYEEPPPQIDIGIAFEILRELFFTEGITKIGHGAITDLTSTAKYWGEVAIPPYGDTLIKQWLLNENMLNKKGLKDLTRLYWKAEYDDEGVGKCVESFPFDKVAYYSYCDSVYTYLLDRRLEPQIIEEGLQPIYDLEMGVLNVLIGMQLNGAKVDVPRLNELKVILADKYVAAEAEVYKAAGRRFNLNSPKQKQLILYGPKPEGQALKPWKLTDGGKKRRDAGFELTISDYSTDAEVLASYPNNVLTKAMMEFADVDKFLNTYVLGWLGDGNEKPCIIYDDHIHADFVQYGTVTGRFSCVSGDTLLFTSRGIFRIDEYIPQDFDKILTHAGNMKPIVRKIYKGQDEILRVSCYNGNTIKCTADHQLYTSQGWIRVGDLLPGDKIIGYDSFSNFYSQSRQYQESTSTLLRKFSETDDARSSENFRYFIPQRTRNSETKSLTGNIEERAKTSVFSFENGQQKLDVWKEWITPSQLSRRNFGRSWISPSEDRGEIRSSSSSHNGTSAWSGNLTDVAGRSPYRRRSVQQFSGQSGFGNKERAWETPFEEIEIREITSVGTMGIWDIEVEGDHSYAAHGFLNHNCREPNLQNIPRPYTELGKLLRGAFIAEDEGKLVIADYAQIELVVLAHYIGQGKLFDGFMAGIDPHTMTAAMVLDKRPEDVTKVERQDLGKTLGFAVVYGAGLNKVASMANISVDRAKEVLAKHERMFPEIYDFRNETIKITKSRNPAYLNTLLGRKRRITGLKSSVKGIRLSAERKAFNSLIQGGAADLLKLAMIRVDAALPPEVSLRMTVHDELILASPEYMAQETAEILREAMTGPGIQSLVRVPLNVDLHIVDRWADAK